MIKINDSEYTHPHDIETDNQPMKCDKYNYLNYLEYVNVGYVLLSADHTILSHNKVIQDHLQNDLLMMNYNVNSLDYSRLSNTLNRCKTISMDDGIASFQSSSMMAYDSIEEKIVYFLEELFNHFIEIDELFRQELKDLIEVNNGIIALDLNNEPISRKNSKKFQTTLSKLIQCINDKLTIENFYTLGVTKIPFRNKFIFLEIKIRMIKVDNREIFYEIMTQDVTNVHEAQMTKNQMTYKSLGLAKVAHDFKNPILSLISLIPCDRVNVTNYNVSSAGQDQECSEDRYSNRKLKRSNRITGVSNDINLFDNNSLIKSFSSYILMLIEDFNVYAKMDIEKVIDNSSTIVEINVVEEIEVRPILEFSVNIFKIRQINEKDKQNINISLVIEDNVPEKIPVNETKLKQVLVNILSNSYKFTIAGEIAVKAKVFCGEESKKYLRITIQDTGVGIKKEDQSKLFTPFKMIDSSKMLNNHGSGLGLLIIKEILNKMNSDIQFVSEPGVGTTFWFDLPINGAGTEISQKSSFSEAVSMSFIDQNMILTESLANVFKRLNSSFYHYDKCPFDEVSIGYSKNKLEVPLKKNPRLTEISNNSNNSNLKNISSNDEIITKPALSSLGKANAKGNEKCELMKIEELLLASKESIPENYKSKNMIRFLLCDDEVMSKVALQKLIVAVCKDKLINYDISLAKNGIECLYIMNLKLFKNEPIDILLIDDQMSIMNGGMTVKIIKDLVEEKKIPNLLKYIVTSNSDSNKHKEFLKNGCEEVVCKPVSKSKILQIISDLRKR